MFLVYYCHHKGLILTDEDINYNYKQLKRHHGEAFARVMRDAGLLNIPNIVHILEFAGNNPEDAQNLVKYIQTRYNRSPKIKALTEKTPFELLDEAGYDAFLVETLERQNSIKKYFRPHEELCTFDDPSRYKTHYMIHAVKRGADKIKPSTKPQRQDGYGTSVISIQISKVDNHISIKNRYNHSVSCCDATFSNNPDNIIPGLTHALNKYFGKDICAADMPEHFIERQGQFMWYEYEIEGKHFGHDCYATHEGIHRINKDHQMLLDCMILDTKTGEITRLYNFFGDEHFKFFESFFKGKKIQVTTNPQNKTQQLISVDNKHIATVAGNYIIELTLPGLHDLDDGIGFECIFFKLQEINLPDIEEIPAGFFSKCQSSSTLKVVNIPKARIIDNSFLFDCDITTLNAPMVEEVGVQVLWYNNSLEYLYMPMLQRIGDDREDSYFRQILHANKVLKSAYVPKLQLTMPEEYARLQTIVAQNNVQNIKCAQQMAMNNGVSVACK